MPITMAGQKSRVTVESLPEEYKGTAIAVDIKGASAKSLFDYMSNEAPQHFNGEFVECKYGTSITCCELTSGYECLMYVGKNGTITSDGPLMDGPPTATDLNPR
jgi:hypothetical protein